MKIGYNLLYLNSKVGGGIGGGVRIYAKCLLQAMATVDPNNEYILFTNKGIKNSDWIKAENFKQVESLIPLETPGVRYLYEQLILPFEVLHNKIDILHSLAYVAPIFLPCANVISVHDTNFIAMRDIISPFRRWPLEFISKRACLKSDAVITISEFSKHEIIKNIGVPPNKINVTLLGPGQAENTEAENPWPEVKRHFGIDFPYLIAFSGKSPHKNISRLIQAFSKISKMIPHRLIIIGYHRREDFTSPSIDLDKFILPGYILQADLLSLMKHASLMVFPSWYEGFGMPILEAQKMGIPVASSNAASLPEVGGDSVAYFDPFDVDAMAEVIKSCLLDSTLQRNLILKGRENLKHFSWKKNAREVLNIYTEIYQQRKKNWNNN